MAKIQLAKNVTQHGLRQVTSFDSGNYKVKYGYEFSLSCICINLFVCAVYFLEDIMSVASYHQQRQDLMQGLALPTTDKGKGKGKTVFQVSEINSDKPTFFECPKKNSQLLICQCGSPS